MVPAPTALLSTRPTVIRRSSAWRRSWRIMKTRMTAWTLTNPTKSTGTLCIISTRILCTCSHQVLALWAPRKRIECTRLYIRVWFNRLTWLLNISIKWANKLASGIILSYTSIPSLLKLALRVSGDTSRGGLVVRIRRSHRRGRGSIPRQGTSVGGQGLIDGAIGT